MTPPETSPLTDKHTPSKDPTFRNYSSDNATAYAKYRSGHNPILIDTILAAHKAENLGGTSILVDVGCGPGTATRSLAPHFDQVYGLDPGLSMIKAASLLGGQTRSGHSITYAVCSAEDIDMELVKFGVQPGTVDLITAATAAHWFDLPKFYTSAARTLKPGGSIAFWCGGSLYTSPETPNVKKVQILLDKFELEILKPYELPGNRLCRELYETLGLPWTLGVDGFDVQSYIHRTWNKHGAFDESIEGGFLKRMEQDWNTLEKGLGTASMVTRWREAHQEQLENGELEDCVTVLMREVENSVNEGMQRGDEGYHDRMVVGTAMGLTMWRKS